MLPIIAIVGRPNVGKSTLFNRLTRSRAALTSDFAGLTRDRQYGKGTIGPIPYIVIDTGGFADAKTQIDGFVVKQSMQAAEESDLILFVVDARSGLTPDDEIIAKSLRKLNKPVCLVVNKVDSGGVANNAVMDFYALGFGDPQAIAAEHGKGILRLMDLVLEEFAAEEKTAAETSAADIAVNDGAVKIAIIGRPNVGKSTLINRIIGEERVISYDEPGTTRDSIYINLQHHNKHYILIDTAGVRRKPRVNAGIEKISVIKTLQAIEDANVVILLIDARENVTEQDLKLLGLVLESGKALVIAVNKWDNIPTSQREYIRNELDRRITFVNFAEIHFISALHGSGVGRLFRSVDNAYRSATKEIKTSKINAVLQAAIENNPPPLVRGKGIKLRYAHVAGYNPPLIIIHGTRTTAIPAHYKKYLMNYFRKKLHLFGTPIAIDFREKKL